MYTYAHTVYTIIKIDHSMYIYIYIYTHTYIYIYIYIYIRSVFIISNRKIQIERLKS